MPSSKVSLSEIAKEAEVSVSAVSLALRNSPKISKKKRDAIKDIARDMGYIQDPRIAELMQHLRTNRENRRQATLGIIIPQLKKNEMNKFPPIKVMLKGIKQKASELGYGVDIFVLEDLRASPDRLKKIMDARGIHGVIVLPYEKGVGTMDLDFTDVSSVTAGYSIMEPNLNRSVPNYLQMMDEILEQLLELGYQKIGLVMTYGEAGGGSGRKLFLSSYYYYQSLIDENLRIPVLRRRNATAPKIRDWIKEYAPEVIISSGNVFKILIDMGYSIPQDIGFASIDLSEEPINASGVDHRYDLMGEEIVKMLVSDINNRTLGYPEKPKILMVDSHFRPGFSLRKVGAPMDIKIRNLPPQKDSKRSQLYSGINV